MNLMDYNIKKFTERIPMMYLSKLQTSINNKYNFNELVDELS